MVRLDTGPPLTLDTRGARDRQAELLDAKDRYAPSLRTVVAIVVILVGAGLWSLLRGR